MIQSCNCSKHPSPHNYTVQPPTEMSHLALREKEATLRLLLLFWLRGYDKTTETQKLLVVTFKAPSLLASVFVPTYMPSIHSAQKLGDLTVDKLFPACPSALQEAWEFSGSQKVKECGKTCIFYFSDTNMSHACTLSTDNIIRLSH